MARDFRFASCLAAVVLAAVVSGSGGYSFGYLHGYEHHRAFIEDDPQYREFREIVLVTIIVGMAVGWWIEWRSRNSGSTLVIKGGNDIVPNLNPGDKVEYEMLPGGQMARQIIRRR